MSKPNVRTSTSSTATAGGASSGATLVADNLTDDAIVTAKKTMAAVTDPSAENLPPPIENAVATADETTDKAKNPLEENPPPPIENVVATAEETTDKAKNPPEENPPPPIENSIVAADEPIVEVMKPPEDNLPQPIESAIVTAEDTAIAKAPSRYQQDPMITPTVLIDMKGNVTFEEGEEGEGPKISIVKIVPSKNASDLPKDSEVNVMLAIQQFPSASQTGLDLPAPQSFVRKNSLPVESEVGLTAVKREPAISNIEIISLHSISSNKKQSTVNSGTLLVETLSIHLSRQENRPGDPNPGVPSNNMDSTGPKATSSNPHVFNVTEELPSRGVPIRRTKSVPHNRRKSILEKLPEDIKANVRIQLQDISTQLRSVMAELIKAADRLDLREDPPNDRKQ